MLLCHVCAEAGGEGRSHSMVSLQLAKLMGDVDADGVAPGLGEGQGSKRRGSSEEEWIIWWGGGVTWGRGFG